MKNKIKFINIILLFTLLLITISCSKYSKDKVEEAWEDNDIEYFNEYLEYARNTDDFVEFMNRMLKLQHTVSLGYGYLDYEKNWKEVDSVVKADLKNNIIKVYKLYFSSCLFFYKDIKQDDLSYIQKNILPGTQYQIAF